MESSTYTRNSSSRTSRPACVTRRTDQPAHPSTHRSVTILGPLGPPPGKSHSRGRCRQHVPHVPAEVADIGSFTRCVMVCRCPGVSPADVVSQLTHRVIGPPQPNRIRGVLDYHGLAGRPAGTRTEIASRHRVPGATVTNQVRTVRAAGARLPDDGSCSSEIPVVRSAPPTRSSAWCKWSPPLHCGECCPSDIRTCRRQSSLPQQIPKLIARVRFSSPALSSCTTSDQEFPTFAQAMAARPAVEQSTDTSPYLSGSHHESPSLTALRLPSRRRLRRKSPFPERRHSDAVLRARSR